MAIKTAFLVCGVMGAVGQLAGAQTYTFDTNDQGWRVFNVGFSGHVGDPASVGVPPFDASLGQPAGSLRVPDLAGETNIGAPAAALGNRSGLYGGSVSYDVMYRTRDEADYSAMVLVGATISLYYPHQRPTLNQWEHWTIPLTEAGWHVNGDGGVAATQADMQQVLANVHGIYIRTEWTTGADDTSIDNIIIAGGTLVCPADVGVQGGVPGHDGLLDNNDFVVFINFFFSADARADVGVQGGIAGHDGLFDNNDFVVFINEFFAGC
jgi:hypothetical protein